MAQILNSEYETEVVYSDDKISESQMLVDQSTMTAEDEGMFKAFDYTAR